jgi:transposase
MQQCPADHPCRAVRVLDAFHVVRLGFAAVDQVRCRIQREHTGHRGRTGDPLYGIRRLLRRAADHHTDRSWARLLAGLDAGYTDDEQLTRLAATIDSWRAELLAYFDTGGISNGPTEAINLLIKKIKRVGHGFRNFDNYPAPPAAALRRRLEHYPRHPDQRPTTTLSGVEPVIH